MPTRRSVGVVRAPAVPEAPDPDEDAALGHLGRDAVVGLQGVGRLVAQVAARYDAGGAVGLREVRDRPHGVADDRDVGTGEWDELVVGVDRLRLFFGPDGDGRERRDQEPGIEHTLDDREDVVMHRDLPEGRPVDEQVVHPCRMHTLEEVVGGHDAEVALQREQGVVDLVHQLGLNGVGQDGVAVLGHPPEMLVEIREGTRRRGAGARRHGSIVRPRRTSSPPDGGKGGNWPSGRVCANGAVGAVGSALA